jgi:hypothetical protein
MFSIRRIASCHLRAPPTSWIRRTSTRLLLTANLSSLRSLFLHSLGKSLSSRSGPSGHPGPLLAAAVHGEYPQGGSLASRSSLLSASYTTSSDIVSQTFPLYKGARVRHPSAQCRNHIYIPFLTSTFLTFTPDVPTDGQVVPGAPVGHAKGHVE